MLFGSHFRTGRAIIGLARSPDGFHFTADPQPFLIPAPDGPFAVYVEFGAEDPRATRLDGAYLITYSAYSENRDKIALAKTRDFTRVGGEVFPDHRGGGLYARLDRPHSEILPGLSGFPTLRTYALGVTPSSSCGLNNITGTK